MSQEDISQMRAQIEAQEKEIKGLQDQLGHQDQQIRVRDAREAFRAAGFNPKHGDLFAGENPKGDITAEAVAEFAAKWDLAPASAGDSSSADSGESSTSGADDGTDALASMDRSGTRTGVGGGGTSTESKLTRPEWMELQATDPVAASQALRQGRVITSANENLRAGQASVRGGNPYEPQLADSNA